jgi:hypothetical protein
LRISPADEASQSAQSQRTSGNEWLVCDEKTNHAALIGKVLTFGREPQSTFVVPERGGWRSNILLIR